MHVSIGTVCLVMLPTPPLPLLIPSMDGKIEEKNTHTHRIDTKKRDTRLYMSEWMNELLSCRWYFSTTTKKWKKKHKSYRHFTGRCFDVSIWNFIYLPKWIWWKSPNKDPNVTNHYSRKKMRERKQNVMNSLSSFVPFLSHTKSRH